MKCTFLSSRSLGLILSAGFLSLALPVAAAEFFVATNGDDANAGTSGKPFATLEAARDAIRKARLGGALPAGGVTVWIRGGTYVRTNSLALSAEDSGSPASPIVYRAYRGEPVRLIGGRAVREFTPASAPDLLARLPEAARGRVLVADLHAAGLADLGELKSRGFGRSLTPAHAELFFAGQPMTLARWPNEGEWTRIAGIPADSGRNDDHGGQIADLKAGFLYEGDRPRPWKDVTNVWVHGYWAYDWANSYERIESLDLDQRLIKTAPPHGLYGFRKGQRFHFLNVLEELDQPGEYVVDRGSGLLYFWPPKPVASGEAMVSVLATPFVSMTEASHVTFRDLAFECTRGTAITIRGGASNLVAGCVLRLIGNHGVSIDGGRGHRVIGCDLENTGDGGVSMSGGDRQTLAPAGHVVENCHFQKQGRWSKCYVPAIGMNGVGLRAAHNLIHDHPHCAILFGGNDHIIEFNEIHHIALETGDVGAIYTGRDYTYRGNVIRTNFIHHTGGVGMGSMGVYMDDCVSGTEITGNIFYEVHWAMFIGGGRDHRVENNLFVDCDPAVRADGRGLDKSPVWRGMVNDTMRRRLRDVPLALYRERYPALRTLDVHYGPPEGPAITGDAFQGVPPEGNVVARNVCVGKWLDLAWHAKPEWFDVRDNYVGPDPGFLDAAKMDFRLKQDSPVWKTGFRPIPVEQIGLRQDEYRARKK